MSHRARVDPAPAWLGMIRPAKVFDLDAYLQRIGLSGRPGLSDVHLAQVTSIPFENLDPHRGVPVSLAIEDLQDKLVRRRRGGYCFEQNLLLGAALQALGHQVELLLARVRLGAAPGALRPRSHLVLRVSADGVIWHADVGFGSGSPLAPLPFGPGAVHEQSGWHFRVVAEAGEYVLQTEGDGGWTDVYGFVPEPVPIVDVETSNWYTSTHFRSPFVTGLIVTSQRRDGMRTSLSDWAGLSLTEERPGARRTLPVSIGDVPGLLEDRFGLGGFALDAEERIVPRAA